MDEISNVNGSRPAQTTGSKAETKNIDLENIDIFYETEKLEEYRETFEETFQETPYANSEEGKKFMQGLIKNKETLCKELGLSEEQYDVFCCMALALASQETGMGAEEGYQDENNGIGKIKRNIGKFLHVLIGGGSASSGLTQMKINDLMNEKLTEKEVELLKELGVDISGMNGNNLYKEPDKAAIATIVRLNSIAQNYDEYKAMLEANHAEINNRLDSNLSEEEKLKKGQSTLDNIVNTYNNVSDEAKSEIRNYIKDWLISTNNSKIGDKVDDKYNEELNLNKLNDTLKANGFEGKLTAEDLDYIRYYLTSEDQEMGIMEYCAYGWNKGTDETGMQLDRTLADKLGTILKNPEDFDYDQFTVNVITLAENYAHQASPNADNDYFEEVFEDYE